MTCAFKASIEHTAAYRERGIVAQAGNEAAVGVVRAVDGHRRATVLYRHSAAIDYPSYHSACILISGVDGACHMQVAERGTAHAAEWCSVYSCKIRLVEGQCVVVAVERTLERVVLAAARHCCHADVVVQLDDLAAVGNAVGDVCGECVPVVGIVYEVRAFRRACTRCRPEHYVDGRAAGAGRATGSARAAIMHPVVAFPSIVVIVARKSFLIFSIIWICQRRGCTVSSLSAITIITAIAAACSYAVETIGSISSPCAVTCGTAAATTTAGTTGTDVVGCTAETAGAAATAAGSSVLVKRIFSSVIATCATTAV